MTRRLLPLILAVILASPAMARELTAYYVVPAAANLAGEGGTEWHTDLSLHNPHTFSLSVTLVFLASGRDNTSAPTVSGIVLAPWETLNLWDVLGPDGFDAAGQKGALLVYSDEVSCASTDCDFAVASRTYTLSPFGGSGEFGQGIPGFPASLGLDATVLAYMPQIMSDADFRTNIGVASWSQGPVVVRVDVQDADGTIVDTSDHEVPPFGQVQWRFNGTVTGGTAVAYLVQGAADALVYPYASVVNEVYGDPTYVEAQLSPVGVSAQAAGPHPLRPVPRPEPVRTFLVDRLREPRRR